LKRRAEEALATDGVACTRLGYDVLVKLTMDDLLEQDSPRTKRVTTSWLLGIFGEHGMGLLPATLGIGSK
jgi:hypothetical protein